MAKVFTDPKESKALLLDKLLKVKPDEQQQFIDDNKHFFVEDYVIFEYKNEQEEEQINLIVQALKINLELIAEALIKGAPNAIDAVDTSNGGYYTPLLACQSIEAIELLLQNDANVYDVDGLSFLVALFAHKDIFKFEFDPYEALQIIAVQRNINVVDEDGHSPLQIAIKAKDIKAAKILIENGAVTNGLTFKTIFDDYQNPMLRELIDLLITEKKSLSMHLERDPEFTLFKLVCRKGYSEYIEKMLAYDESLEQGLDSSLLEWCFNERAWAALALFIAKGVPMTPEFEEQLIAFSRNLPKEVNEALASRGIELPDNANFDLEIPKRKHTGYAETHWGAHQNHELYKFWDRNTSFYVAPSSSEDKNQENNNNNNATL